jgi:hypothetical protein
VGDKVEVGKGVSVRVAVGGRAVMVAVGSATVAVGASAVIVAFTAAAIALSSGPRELVHAETATNIITTHTMRITIVI